METLRHQITSLSHVTSAARLESLLVLPKEEPSCELMLEEKQATDVDQTLGRSEAMAISKDQTQELLNTVNIVTLQNISKVGRDTTSYPQPVKVQEVKRHRETSLHPRGQLETQEGKQRVRIRASWALERLAWLVS